MRASTRPSTASRTSRCPAPRAALAQPCSCCPWHRRLEGDGGGRWGWAGRGRAGQGRLAAGVLWGWAQRASGVQLGSLGATPRGHGVPRQLQQALAGSEACSCAGREMPRPRGRWAGAGQAAKGSAERMERVAQVVQPGSEACTPRGHGVQRQLQQSLARKPFRHPPW